jgi:hypothetical protein
MLKLGGLSQKLSIKGKFPNLNQHVASVHEGNQQISKVYEKNKSFKCYICNKTFTFKIKW